MTIVLKYAHHTLSHQSVSNISYDAIPFLDAVLQEVATNDYSAYPILQAYYYAYRSITESEDTDHFFTLKSYLEHPLLQQKEKIDLLEICINYTSRKGNKGQRKWIKTTFELYQYGIKHHLLFADNRLSPHAYDNVVTLGVHFEEFDWTQAFIKKYTPFLEAAVRENCYNFSLAKIALAQGQNEEAMQILQQVNPSDLLHQIATRAMLLRIYYEEKYNKSLVALLESFKVFLNRKKILSYHKTNYKNLISFVEKMRQLTSKKTAKALKEEVIATQQVAEKTWLLRQLENFNH